MPPGVEALNHYFADKNSKVSIAGMSRRNPSRSGGAAEFVGMYTKKDLQIEKKRLEGIIEGYREQKYPCPYNLSTGMVDCFDTCVSYDIDVKCPEEVKFDAERQLDNLETRHLMKHAFSHPELAHLNDYLQGEKVIYGHRSVLKIQNNGSLGWYLIMKIGIFSR